jgi:hypothetical protein
MRTMQPAKCYENEAKGRGYQQEDPQRDRSGMAKPITQDSNAIDTARIG